MNSEKNELRRATPVPDGFTGVYQRDSGWYALPLTDGSFLDVPPGWWLPLEEGDYVVIFQMGYRVNFMEKSEDAIDYCKRHSSRVSRISCYLQHNGILEEIFYE